MSLLAPLYTRRENILLPLWLLVPDPAVVGETDIRTGEAVLAPREGQIDVTGRNGTATPLERAALAPQGGRTAQSDRSGREVAAQAADRCVEARRPLRDAQARGTTARTGTSSRNNRSARSDRRRDS